MLKLGASWVGNIPTNDPGDPRPFLMPGVRVKFATISKKASRAAYEAVRVILLADEAAADAASDAIGEELIRRGLLEWEGVGDGEGEPIPVTAEAIEAFIQDPDAYAAANVAYVQPWVFRDREGNASAGSPDGIGTKATPATITATSPATRKRTAAVARTRKPARKAVRT